jgi:hypothetical protein
MFTLLCVVNGSWINADTGDVIDPLSCEGLESYDGGVVCGYNIYEQFADGGRASSIYLKQKGDWKLKLPGRRMGDNKPVRRYFYRATRRFPLSKGSRHERCRPKSIVWVIWNLEIFNNNPQEDVIETAKRMRRLCEDRGIKPAATPGGMGKAMLKASPEWAEDRYFAPPWISEFAREHLPGNYYALREGFKKSDRVLLIDQRAAHHNIVNSTPCPLPNCIRRRGRRTTGVGGRYISVKSLRDHIGLLHLNMEVDTIPEEQKHLYPHWGQVSGRKYAWIWTPELRLMDRRTRILEVQTALTGKHVDTALWEYSDFALNEISKDSHPAIKPVLHAAYGNLGVGRYKEFEQILLGDASTYKNPKKVRIGWIEEEANSVTIKGIGISHTQNVIAYGVIQAEQTVRSLELARQYESMGIMVVQVYADAILLATTQVPFTPPGWDVKADLGELVAGHANQIIAANLQRIPGMHGERRRMAYVEQTRAA